MRPLSRLLATSALLAGLLTGCGGNGDEDDEPRPASTTPASTTPASTTPASTTPAPAEQRPLIGIGEQGTAMFTNPAFRALKLRHVRLVVAYDATRVGYERDLVDTWLKAARAVGAEPFVTFGHSRERPKRLPSAREFRSRVREFRARYPQVKVYAPWNEINHSSQPTHDAPGRAAEYYNVLREECAGCTVLAGDVLDQRGMAAYVKRYQRGLKGEPAIWGLHNYADANRFRSSGLKTLLGSVTGDVWLTETGGLVEFGSSFPRDEQRAAKAVRYVLRRAREEPRVQRVYLYNWTGSEPGVRFDSGLVGPTGEPRPGYRALRAALVD